MLPGQEGPGTVLRLAVFVMGFGIGAVIAGVIAWKKTHNDDKTLAAAVVVGVVLGLLCMALLVVGEVRCRRCPRRFARCCAEPQRKLETELPRAFALRTVLVLQLLLLIALGAYPVFLFIQLGGAKAVEYNEITWVLIAIGIVVLVVIVWKLRWCVRQAVHRESVQGLWGSV